MNAHLQPRTTPMLMRAYPDCLLRLPGRCLLLIPQLTRSSRTHHHTMTALQTEPLWH
jgi:hypothetical protein